jgi:hypothetical protein
MNRRTEESFALRLRLLKPGSLRLEQVPHLLKQMPQTFKQAQQSFK